MRVTNESSVVQDSEIFELFGRLAFGMQLFDFSLAHVLGQVFGPGPYQRSASQVREEIEKLYLCTAGQLSGKLRSVLGEDDPLVRRIADAVKQRNYFIHRFFRETSANARTDDGRRAMLESMQAAENLFGQLDDELTEVYRRWLASHGVDESK